MVFKKKYASTCMLVALFMYGSNASAKDDLQVKAELKTIKGINSVQITLSNLPFPSNHHWKNGAYSLSLLDLDLNDGPMSPAQVRWLKHIPLCRPINRETSCSTVIPYDSLLEDGVHIDNILLTKYDTKHPESIRNWMNYGFGGRLWTQDYKQFMNELGTATPELNTEKTVDIKPKDLLTEKTFTFFYLSTYQCPSSGSFGGEQKKQIVDALKRMVILNGQTPSIRRPSPEFEFVYGSDSLGTTDSRMCQVENDKLRDVVISVPKSLYQQYKSLKLKEFNQYDNEYSDKISYIQWFDVNLIAKGKPGEQIISSTLVQSRKVGIKIGPALGYGNSDPDGALDQYTATYSPSFVLPAGNVYEGKEISFSSSPKTGKTSTVKYAPGDEILLKPGQSFTLIYHKGKWIDKKGFNPEKENDPTRNFEGTAKEKMKKALDKYVEWVTKMGASQRGLKE